MNGIFFLTRGDSLFNTISLKTYKKASPVKVARKYNFYNAIQLKPELCNINVCQHNSSCRVPIILCITLSH